MPDVAVAEYLPRGQLEGVVGMLAGSLVPKIPQRASGEMVVMHQNTRNAW
jgi:hypothetical protein